MLDKIDRQLIELLRQDARLSYRDLGEQVSLSANTVADRVRRLVNENILLGFSAKVNFAALDLNVQAVIDVKMLPTTSAAFFESAIASIPGVVEATLTTGSYDYILRVVCAEHADLVTLIEALRSRAGVQDTHSRVVLRQVNLNAPLT
ncbi:Lrp/AsnC family transcriptional regulator [Undibacterium sp.]|uniref:Lrp/AsnC family transcriptional regulator n=1 Tax=Undibacterium sp. TaxID=1914977 RepID=UPI0037539EEC